MPTAPRWPRTLLLATILPACWLGMMAVHELGHVLAAWLAGAEVHRVVLPLFSFSRTDVAYSEWQRAIIWAGPAVGVVLPILMWLAARAMKWEIAFVPRFFAGFCLIANGAYFATSEQEAVGDAGDLIRLGVPWPLLTTVGCAATIAGLCFWSNLGARFGIGKDAKPVSPRIALGVLAMLIALVALPLAVGGASGAKAGPPAP